MGRFGSINEGENYLQAVEQLLKEQRDEWPLLNKGAASLSLVKEREFNFDGFTIKIQFNPGRIISSSAKVDPQSIKERKCFLCVTSLPAEQRGIEYKYNLVILANPFPIFPNHLTIPLKEHLPQEIKPYIKEMLSLSKDLGDKFTVFYNGPRCGASAPDHFHFQAGDRGFMTIDTEYKTIKKKYTVKEISKGGVSVIFINDGLRRFAAIESESEIELINSFNELYDQWAKLGLDEGEPLLNVLSLYEEGSYRVILFFREKHRPWQYFAEGGENILFSPASVDIGGVSITPLEKDFLKISEEDLINLFNQVIISEEKFSLLINHFSA